MRLLPFFLVLGFSACQYSGSTDENASVIDTITTASGLQYYYLEKGEGRQIAEGSKVSAYNKLYLSGSDTVFWSTDDSKDSVFHFVMGKTPLIDGASELYPILREGDKVVAIMGPDIAYGDNDRNGLPGGSTLTFDPIIIKKVSEPKKMLSDTLNAVVQNGTVAETIEVYNSIAESELSDNFHMELSLVSPLLNNLMKAGKYQELEEIASTFRQSATESDDRQTMSYYMILAAERQNNLDQAIVYVKQVLEEIPDEKFYLDKLAGLEKLKATRGE